MEPVLFKERNDGHAARGAGLLGVLSRASTPQVLGAVQSEDWPQTVSEVKDGSKGPLLPGKARGKPWQYEGPFLSHWSWASEVQFCWGAKNVNAAWGHTDQES